jgi:hypothetical protein
MNLGRIHLVRTLVLLLATTSITTAADQARIRATLQPVEQRKPAPELALKDSSGKPYDLRIITAKWFCSISGPPGVTDAKKRFHGFRNSSASTVPKV